MASLETAEAHLPPSPVSSGPSTPLDDEPPISPSPVASMADTHHTGSPSAFSRLPDEIIQQILEVTDPNSFASLVLLNSKWRRVSQQAHLYALHLSRCASFAAANSSVLGLSTHGDSLSKLRPLFAREVKRNLFEAYLRPKTTTIKLISNSISASSAPGGEGLQFSPSPKGHHLLAYNSSRIYIIDARRPDIAVERELKILRRPVSVCILDDGSLLAVLSPDLQVDIYDLQTSPPRRKQSMILDNTPRAIALSPCGKVLAAAYEGGIEVSSINPGALPTDRRAVKCDSVDSLAFSFDGTQLLGTTGASQAPNTVILTAPYYDPGAQMTEDNISAMWTTSILFPNTSRDCSHAVLLQESSSLEAAWTFTYDRSFETFRAVRIDDLRNGTTYFPGPVPTRTSGAPLLPSTLPAASYFGELVAAGFEGQDVWLYGVPEDLEAVPESNPSTELSSEEDLHRRGSGRSLRSSSRPRGNDQGRVPQWQLLCDKMRNTFVGGRKITQLRSVSTVKWVKDVGDTKLQERLIVAARGILPPKPITEEDGIDFVDGGRLTILDFDYGTGDGETKEITIEVGTKEPEVLEEESRDMDTEVAIVRRRTVAQSRGARAPGMRASTSASAHEVDSLLRSPRPLAADSEDPLIPRRMPAARSTAEMTAPAELEDVSLEEAQEALDAPYAHASPRSGNTLRRAATAVAVNRRRNPEPATAGQVTYRRADGRREHPHESDADNWVPPPPPYAKEDPGETPDFLRHAPMAAIGATQPAAQPPATPTASVSVPSPLSGSSHGRPQLPRIQTSPTQNRQNRATWGAGAPQQRVSSSSLVGGPTSSPRANYAQRRVSNPAPIMRSGVDPNAPPVPPVPEIPRQDDIYDVSPVAPPRRAATSHSAILPNSQPQWPSPQHVPSAAVSSATEQTPASSVSYQTSSSQRSAWSPDAGGYGAVPVGATMSPRSTAYTTAGPAVPSLPNAHTWPYMPGQPRPGTVIEENEGPRAAAHSTRSQNNLPNGSTMSLPPPPRQEQVASLHRRQDSHPPNRASGIFQVPRVPVGSRASQDYTSTRHSMAAPVTRPMTCEPDQPLIISTPTGVSGAFDSAAVPGPRAASAGPVIFAPVPRHPRPATQHGVLRPPPTAPFQGVYGVDGAPAARSEGHILAPPSAQLTETSLRHHTSLTRRQSRARRSAAKNMLDAKSRGWTLRRKDKKKHNKEDSLSAAGWTDLTWAADGAPRAYHPTQQSKKDKKCVIM